MPSRDTNFCGAGGPHYVSLHFTYHVQGKGFVILAELRFPQQLLASRTPIPLIQLNEHPGPLAATSPPGAQQ